MLEICRSLQSGHITGIDSSVLAIAKARTRLIQQLRAGTARLQNTTLIDFKSSQRFCKVFAVNVNAFWTAPRQNLGAVAHLLEPGGTLHLFYQQPSQSQLDKAESQTVAGLAGAGFEIASAQQKRLDDGNAVAVVASTAR